MQEGDIGMGKGAKKCKVVRRFLENLPVDFDDSMQRTARAQARCSSGGFSIGAGREECGIKGWNKRTVLKSLRESLIMNEESYFH